MIPSFAHQCLASIGAEWAEQIIFMAAPGESGEKTHAAMRLARKSSSQAATLRLRRMESLVAALRMTL